MLTDNGHVKTDDGSNSSLLRTATDGISLNYSGGRRSRLSGLPLGAHRIADYSPLPPTAVESGAARRSGDRPTVIAEVLSVTASPRPGPASLLTSSGRPQQVRLRLRGGRAGSAHRAHKRISIMAAACCMDLIGGPAHARSLTSEAAPAALHIPQRAARCSGDIAWLSETVAGDCMHPTACRYDERVQSYGTKETRNGPHNASAPSRRAPSAPQVGTIGRIPCVARGADGPSILRPRGAPGPMPVARRG